MPTIKKDILYALMRMIPITGTPTSKITQISTFFNAVSWRTLGSVVSRAVAALKRLMTVGIVLGISSLVLTGCGKKHSWKQKLTVNVETPAGLRSGSAVVQVDTVFYGQLPLTGTEISASKFGEATYVNLGRGRYLIAVMGKADKIGSWDTTGLASRVWRDQIANSRKKWLYQIPKIKGIGKVPRKHYPFLVTFTNINDPRTIVRVNPDNLAKTFGQGFKLASITLEITDEGVSAGQIENILPCLKTIQCIGKRENSKSTEPLYFVPNSWFRIRKKKK